MDRSAAADLAREWWARIAHTCALPTQAQLAVERLTTTVVDLAAALTAEPFDPSAGVRAGAELIDINCADESVLAATGAVLGRLPGLIAPEPDPAWHLRTTELIGAIGQGYAGASRRRTLDGQAALQQAMNAARLAAEQRMRLLDIRFRVVFNHAAVAIAIGDTGGLFLDANPALAAMLGRERSELRGAPVFDIVHPDDRDEVQAVVYDELAAAGAGTVRIEVRYMRADGGHGWASWAVTVLQASGEQEPYLLAVGEDTTERREQRTRLEYQAGHDQLTGLPNRTRLLEQLDAALRDAGQPSIGAVLFCDLDGFKQVNDDFGHAVGDEVLRSVAERLHRAVRGAVISRLGGDEFVVLVGTGGADTVAACEARLHAALATPITLPGDLGQVTLGVSVGVAAVESGDRRAADQVLRDADAAMYAVKAARRAGTFLSHGS